MAGDALYGESDKAGDKKLVNISIDELNADEMPSDCEINQAHQNAAAREQMERSKWIEVIRESSQPTNNNNQGQQPS